MIKKQLPGTRNGTWVATLARVDSKLAVKPAKILGNGSRYMCLREGTALMAAQRHKHRMTIGPLFGRLGTGQEAIIETLSPRGSDLFRQRV